MQSNLPLHIVATALLAGVGACAHAQSPGPTLYGIVDAFTGRYQLAGRGYANVVNSGGMSTSSWGVAGSEDLGSGLRATYNLSAFFRADSGAAGRFDSPAPGVPGDTFFGKRASVGFAGPWGSLDVGRLSTPVFISMIQFNPYADAAVFAPIFLHMYTGGQPVAAALATEDSAANNAVQYVTPVFAGLRASVQYAFGEVVDHNGVNRVSSSLTYNLSGFGASVAYARDRFVVAVGERQQTTWLGGLSYDFTVVKLFAQYARSELDALNRTYRIAQGGFSIPLAGGRILASWGGTRLDLPTGVDPHRDTITLGYDYDLSRRTDAYVLAMHDKVTNVSNGHSAVVGLRHRF